MVSVAQRCYWCAIVVLVANIAGVTSGPYASDLGPTNAHGCPVNGYPPFARGAMVLWAVALALSAVGTIVAVLVARRRRSVDHLVAALVGVAWLAAITAPAVLNTLGHESCWA